ncbi:MAG TPA: large conductance mechanosensitive channel protein MscL [Jiangellales bacterium]|nr:large conductance mechanosensitive channel protein MscL [Jiangellales bacterium]
MIKGFRDFITRGNVLDLAVAVVIGTAFTAVVTSVVENLLNPVIAAVGSPDTGGLATPLRDFPEATVNWGEIITALINFVLIAAVVYFVFVAPTNRFRRLRASGDEDQPGAPAEDVLLLQEIRDLLRAQQGLPPTGPSARTEAPRA